MKHFCKFSICLMVCFSFLLGVMPSAFAAVPSETIDPFDYLISISSSGDKSLVTFSLDSDDITPYHRLSAPLSDGSYHVEEYVVSNYTASFSSISNLQKQYHYWCFPLGSYYQRGTSTPEGGIDVSGLLNGSSIDFTVEYDLELLVIPSPSGPSPTTFNHIVDVRQYLHLYDADGMYVNTITSTGATKSFRLSDGTVTWSFVLSDILTVSSDVQYIIPYLEVNGSDTYTLSTWKLSNYSPTLSWSCSIDAVDDDSLLMQAINAQLGNIGDSLDDIDQGIQDANDKLDDIKSGIGSINSSINKPAGIDKGAADFGSASDGLSDSMAGAVTAIGDGADLAADLSTAGAMRGTLTTLTSCISAAFAPGMNISICGITLNPFSGWVIVIGGISLIGLIINYIFRKRGGK